MARRGDVSRVAKTGSRLRGDERVNLGSTQIAVWVTGRSMNRVWRRVRRFARRFGFARVLCLLLLIGLAALRVADPPRDRRAAGQDLRYLSANRSAEKDLKAGRHRRSRRQEPRQIRSVAVAAHSHRRYGQPRCSQLGAVAIGFDILFLRTGSHVARIDCRDTSRSRRRDERQASRVAEQRPGASRCNAANRASCLAKPVLHTVTGSGYITARRHRLRRLGGEPQPFLIEFDGLLRNIKPLGAVGRWVAASSPSCRARRHRASRADDHAGAGCYDALALASNCCESLTGTDTVLVKSDAEGVKSVGVRGSHGSDRSQRPALGAFRAHDPEIYVSAADVLDGTVSPQDSIARHIVLVGTSAVGLLDVKTTPARSRRAARRRGSCPGAREHAEPDSIVATELGPRTSSSSRPCCSVSSSSRSRPCSARWC